MFQRWIRRSVLGVGLALALMATARPAAADDHKSNKDKGFEKLFNGENLDGWKGDPKLWSVENGAITGRTTEDNPLPYNKFLVWQGEPVENFVLKLKFRLEGNNNSGIQYRSRHLKDEGEYVVKGYQADIHPSPKYLGMLYDERGRGITAQCGQKVVIAPDGKKHVVGSLGDPKAIHRNTDLSEWNDYTIIARGNRMIHKINGQTTAIIIDHQTSERELSGNIALQVHRGPPMLAQFKNIRLKRLPEGGLIEPTNTPGTSDKGEADPQATAAEDISVPEGFEVDLLHSVPEGQGSWVSLAFDDRGRLVASDQYGGLYRVDPSPAGSDRPSYVEKLTAEMGHAQGLLHAFGSLYAVVNGKAAKGGGLYRLQDTTGDEQYDKVELLQKIPGGSGQEHGPHSIRLSPDGESLYVIGGNMSRIWEPRTSSRVPEVWEEDQLLPRMPDARGHASNTMAPGGGIVKTDPDGESWELIASGFRNPYDFDFNREGELFTYDADMEWDIGLPWYRPTRINHAVSGAEFGWRNGSGKWPAYYPDSLPAAVNIGPGSPTGVVFGYDTNFPQPHRDALFICDWSYGKLYAVHLEPDGASYTGEFDTFASASPLPLTDVVVGPDGALYFAIGGRRTQSGLYRIRYTGEKSGDAAPEKTEGSKKARQLRKLRHRLENLHKPETPAAVDAAWPHLDHEDRFIRYAARIAIEHQDVKLWRGRALKEKDPKALINVMVALARHGEPADQPKMIEALGRVDWSPLAKPQKLALLRAYGLAFIRLGEPSSTVRRAVIERLSSRFPADDVELDMELSRLLAYLEAPDVAAKTVQLLEEAPSQEEQIHYAYVLRTVENGWTMDLRRRYFGWFTGSGQHAGGMSFTGYLKNIKKAAEKRLSKEQKEALSDVLKAEPKQQPKPSESREFVKNWQMKDLLPAIEDGLSGRDFQRGKKMFGAALCFRCHRFDGRGGIGGPDLTGVAGRFSPEDLLESIIEPSKEISDQYQNVVIKKKDGSAVQGRIINLAGNNLRVSPNPMVPSNIVSVNRDKVESIEPSSASPMPPGLLNTLNKQEVLDLMAYMLSRGDPDHEMFD